jgi:nucleoside-diphosphate-sugar epimerase
MRAFVTGGSGFVGRALLRTLAARGDQAVALARSDRATDEVQAAGAAEVVRGDLDEVATMAGAMAGCDVVFHSAAVVKDWGDPAEFHKVNVTGTGNALDAARRAGVPRFVHVGTEAVLVGGPPIVNVDETVLKPERPMGLYPLTKARAEDLVLAASDDALAAVVVRPRFVWGAGDTTLLPQIVDAVRSKRFRWIAGGDYRTSTCHVDNVVEGMLLAAERGRAGSIYFLTDGEPVVFREFVTELLATVGVDPGPKSVPRWVARSLAWTVESSWKLFGIDRPPPMTRTALRLIGEEVTVSDRKAREDIGYQGKVSIEAGLAAMRQAHRAGQM